jgi:ribosome biogenesis protein UTP30
MTAKAASAKAAKAAKAAKTLKSPKLTKADKTAKKQDKNENDNRHKTGLDAKLVERAVEALLAYHEKQSEDKLSLLGNDKPIQVQFTLLRSPSNGNPKPIRILIPHPLFQLADKDDDSDSAMEEPEICLIVKEESKPWCQEMIDRFPEHMGCVKKVLGLQSLRKKHGSYEQRRELLSKYNFFMADDRILPMLSKALGKEFFKAKKLPIPISLTRKEALPFAIQKALSATYMSVSSGTCITIR